MSGQDIHAATEPAPEMQRSPLLERRRHSVMGDITILRPLLVRASMLLGSVSLGPEHRRLLETRRSL